MIEYKRNNEALKAAVREHSIAGYPLKVPMFGDAFGVSAGVGGHGISAVIVAPKEPRPFEELAQSQGWRDEKQDMAYWVNYSRQKNQPSLIWMHPHSQAILEDGYKVSERDIKKAWLRAMGHVDSSDRVQKYSFDLSQVSMHPDTIEPGMIVEFADGDREYKWAGRVVGVEKDPQDGSKIIYLETFEPVPSLLAPHALAPWMIQPAFVPDKTWVLGYGTYEAMKRKKVKIPAGMFDPKDSEKRVYFLDQPVPLAEIEEFCTKNYSNEPQCVWQSMVLIVLPLHPAKDGKGRHQGGTFRPFPDKILKTEIEAQIDYYGDQMEFEP